MDIIHTSYVKASQVLLLNDIVLVGKPQQTDWIILFERLYLTCD